MAPLAKPLTLSWAAALSIRVSSPIAPPGFYTGTRRGPPFGATQRSGWTPRWSGYRLGMAWKRIACSVDFSPESRAALDEAAQLATRYGAELTLVHVDDRAREPTTDATLSSAVSLERGRLELERLLGEWSDDARKITSRPVEFLLLSGDPASQVLKAAAELPFDVVVMGTHGRAEVDRLRFGSVAEAVVRDARCSVLVVRRPSP